MAGKLKEPFFFFLMVINVIAAIISILIGIFLIQASMFPTSMEELNEIVKEAKMAPIFDDVNYKSVVYMQQISIVLGGLSIIFSSFFIWTAIHIGIIYFWGEKEDFCLCDQKVKREILEVTLKTKNVR